jgi:single-stranded DNA-binding protein
MALNTLSIEGTVHTKPEAPRAAPGRIEFILRHEARESGAVHFFPVEAWSCALGRSRLREGSEVIVLGALGERQWVDPRTGEVRLSVIVRAQDLREVTGSARRDRDEGFDEIPF